MLKTITTIGEHFQLSINIITRGDAMFWSIVHARGNFAQSAIPVGVEPTTKTNTLASPTKYQHTFCTIKLINYTIRQGDCLSNTLG